LFSEIALSKDNEEYLFVLLILDLLAGKLPLKSENK
jgi:hypothetical protein